MREFFRGWRRKVGVVTLAVACVLMGMWCRSQFTQDTVRFQLGNRIHKPTLLNGSVAWTSYDDDGYGRSLGSRPVNQPALRLLAALQVPAIDPEEKHRTHCERGSDIMRESFKGWRRKVGCVTLVMACVLATSWFRSFRFSEYVQIYVVGFGFECGHSQGRLVLLRKRPHPERLLDCAWDSSPSAPWPQNTWWKWNSHTLTIPHVEPTTSLTLLSAYLIVWTPQKKPKPGSVTNA